MMNPKNPKNPENPIHPENPEKNEVMQVLTALGIPFELQEHPAVFTMAEAEAEKLFERGVVPKNLFLKEKKGHRRFLVTARNDGAVDLKALRKAVSARELTFAAEEELKTYLGLMKGAVTPFGILNDRENRVEAVTDRKLKGGAELGLHPNINTATLWLTYDNLLRFFAHIGREVHEVEVVYR